MEPKQKDNKRVEVQHESQAFNPETQNYTENHDQQNTVASDAQPLSSTPTPDPSVAVNQQTQQLQAVVEQQVDQGNIIAPVSTGQTQPTTTPVDLGVAGTTQYQVTSAQPTAPASSSLMPSFQQNTSSKGKFMVIAVLAAFAALVAVGVLLAIKVFGTSGINLVQYEGETFSISYPEGYEKETVQEFTTFSEPIGEGEDEKQALGSQSSITVDTRELPSTLSSEQKAEITRVLNDPEAIVDSLINIRSTELKNKKLKEDIKLGGVTGVGMSAEVFEADEKIGDIYIAAAADDSKYVFIMITVHKSDPGLIREAQNIVESFKFKE